MRNSTRRESRRCLFDKPGRGSFPEHPGEFGEKIEKFNFKSISHWLIIS